MKYVVFSALERTAGFGHLGEAAITGDIGHPVIAVRPRKGWRPRFIVDILLNAHRKQGFQLGAHWLCMGSLGSVVYFVSVSLVLGGG